MDRTELNIAKEFTDTPGPRKKTEGKFSGEAFLDQLLRPSFLLARKNNFVLSINLDGAVGYPTSFLEEAFGGLAREFGGLEVQKHIEICCNDEPYLREQISKYIGQATKAK